MDLADVEVLTRPDVARLLTDADAWPEAGDPLRLTTRLRRDGLSPTEAAAVATQLDLRRRARAKVGDDADVLLFTPAGHQQATRRSVADHRAARLSAVGVRSLVDLGCGIGGDTIAAARAGLRVLAVERDPLTAAVARANVEALGLSGLVDVEAADGVDLLRSGRLDEYGSAFVDPARRNARGRVFDPDAYDPPFSFVRELAARVPATVAKVAPGIPRDLGGPDVEAEWVSDGGDVKEAVLWHGPLAASDVRVRATLLPAGVTVTDLDPSSTDVRAPGRWLHEPDGAVVRSGLVGQVAAALNGGLVDPTIAYVTTDDDVTHPAARRFEVVASQPFGLKPLRATLRSLGAGDVVVKKRGSAIEPTELRRRLRLDGAGPTMTVVVTRVDGRPWTFVCT